MPSSPPPSPPPVVEHVNRLVHEKSPYLLQHAHNPVDWYPWGKEAFDKARAEDKPIFLSVGYSTCHWCHVMARESFENPKIAALMNRLFVNIKVDREERPDVDRVYMTFVQATTGSGGWPMSVWLQPDLKPIFGGTYFPPDDRYGRRGFPVVCQALADAWHDDRAKLSTQSDRVVAALQDYAAKEHPTDEKSLPALDAAAWQGAQEPYLTKLDHEWGGFGTAPKFPRPVVLGLLALTQYRLGEDGTANQSKAAREALLLTLDKMAAGGMHDHLGGGFHRYSVDRFWHVPHFEKMLYDQAQLAVSYLEAFQITGNEKYAAVARDVLEYVARDLTSPEGGFYSAEDADSSLSFEHPEQHAEGAFYAWTLQEITSALTPEESRVFCRHFGVEAAGNCPRESDPQGEFKGKNVLIERQGLAQTTALLKMPAVDAGGLLESARRKLFAVRERRPRPHRDDKILTAWNGLMISAYARAYRVLHDEKYLTAARRSADFIRTQMYSDAAGKLRRSFREGPGDVDGFADDYAFLVQGLLDQYEAGFDVNDLLWARKLQQKQDELFFDEAEGGYFGSSLAGARETTGPSLPLRIKEDNDGAEPSASSVSALNLARLAAIFDDEAAHRRGLRTVAAFADAGADGSGKMIARLAQTLPAMLTAWDFLTREPESIILAGVPHAADTRALAHAANQPYVPARFLIAADGGEGQKLLAKAMPYLDGIGSVDGHAAAYRCRNGACQLPTIDPAELLKAR